MVRACLLACTARAVWVGPIAGRGSAQEGAGVSRTDATPGVTGPCAWFAGALLFGAQRPQRSIVMFGADGQRWPVVSGALREGLVADGDVTLVLERALPKEGAGAAGGSAQQQFPEG